jgi:hypothetical protein
LVVLVAANALAELVGSMMAPRNDDVGPQRTESPLPAGSLGHPWQTCDEVATALEQARPLLHTARQRVVQQDRLLALGEMASGIAHDFNSARV